MANTFLILKYPVTWLLRVMMMAPGVLLERW